MPSEMKDSVKLSLQMILFRDGKATLYSMKEGALIPDVRMNNRYPTNAISLGTRPALKPEGRAVWELDFIRWTDREARFQPPEAGEDTNP